MHAPPTHVFLRCDSLRRAEWGLVDILFHQLPCNLDCFSPLRGVLGVDPTGERVGHFTLGTVLGMSSLAWVSWFSLYDCTWHVRGCRPPPHPPDHDSNEQKKAGTAQFTAVPKMVTPLRT